MAEELGSFLEEVRGLAIRSRSAQLRDALDRLDRRGHSAAGEVQRLMGRLVELGPALGELAAAASGERPAPGSGGPAGGLTGGSAGGSAGLPAAAQTPAEAHAGQGRHSQGPPAGTAPARHGFWRHRHGGDGRTT